MSRIVLSGPERHRMRSSARRRLHQCRVSGARLDAQAVPAAHRHSRGRHEHAVPDSRHGRSGRGDSHVAPRRSGRPARQPRHPIHQFTNSPLHHLVIFVRSGWRYSLGGVAAVAANRAVDGSGSLVSRRSLLTSPTISMTPQLRHMVALVMTSPVARVRNFESCGRNEVRTAENSAPAESISPPHR